MEYINFVSMNKAIDHNQTIIFEIIHTLGIYWVPHTKSTFLTMKLYSQLFTYQVIDSFVFTAP